jgi:phosphoadenosine phosphosulfate reductase
MSVVRRSAPATPVEIDLDRVNDALEPASPAAVLSWAWETFGPDIAASSSFQSQSIPLLHLIAGAVPELPVLFLDTGFHFQETLAFRDQLTAEFGLNLVVLHPELGHAGFRRRYGDLYREDPDLCCYLNKVEPMERALAGQRAWISGIRRDQSPTRADTPIVSRLDNGLYKVCPMATMTRRDVWDYAQRHTFREHPLLAKGYVSIGCAPCTRPVWDDGDRGDGRAGRWAGRDKTECGLHTDLGKDRRGR